MTEDEWMACTDPDAMLEFLRGKASARKLRLFCCACSRFVWSLIEEAEARLAIELSESFADGQSCNSELVEAARAVNEMNEADWLNGFCGLPTRSDSGQFFLWTAAAWEASKETVRPEGVSAKVAALAGENNDVGMTTMKNVLLLRDIFNPFRPVTISPAVLAWHDAIIVRLAQAAYDERHLPSGTLDSGRLAILADALEEAGCTSEEMLGHLRGPGPHVRGCWSVDTVLGKS